MCGSKMTKAGGTIWWREKLTRSCNIYKTLKSETLKSSKKNKPSQTDTENSSSFLDFLHIKSNINKQVVCFCFLGECFLHLILIKPSYNQPTVTIFLSTCVRAQPRPPRRRRSTFNIHALTHFINGGSPLRRDSSPSAEATATPMVAPPVKISWLTPSLAPRFLAASILGLKDVCSSLPGVKVLETAEPERNLRFRIKFLFCFQEGRLSYNLDAFLFIFVQFLHLTLIICWTKLLCFNSAAFFSRLNH